MNAVDKLFRDSYIEKAPPKELERFATIIGKRQKTGEPLDDFKQRLRGAFRKPVSARASIHDIGAELLESVTDAISVGVMEELMTHKSKWWRRIVFNEKSYKWVRPTFIVITRRTSYPIALRRTEAETALSRVKPAGVDMRVEVLDQVGLL